MKKPKIGIDKPFDHGLYFIIEQMKKSILDKDDDFLLLICGDTGTGKSHLMMHIYQEICGDDATHDNICFDTKDFFTIAKKVGSSKPPRFFAFDEADVSKRSSLSTLNRDLIKYYMSVRGQNIVHIWCTPSADMLDKFFLNERVKGLIFVANKSVNHPRAYFYYMKKDLIKLLDKRGDLKQSTLKRNASSFAFYRGFFKQFNGKLLDDYNKKKKNRMQYITDELFEKYVGTESFKYKSSDVGKMLRITAESARVHAVRFEEQGLLVPEVHFVKNAVGHRRFNEEGLKVFKENYGKKRKVK